MNDDLNAIYDQLMEQEYRMLELEQEKEKLTNDALKHLARRYGLGDFD